ncbi:putative rRNA methyltransferase [Solanum tuberosum]|uniref:putative rRNA methyltransferase n=1 Tax=Solanum tuberosum TaxID=4113 RepID=UPI0003D281ED|nr:PREDICTED: putative rRNA methyltransferase [Solanum tuberosum]
MGKVKGKHRLDKYYHLAKEQGYRSRAAWKLIQLDSKFSFLRSSQSVLDLCAAPGGWMQVAVKHVPVGSLVIGVDLDPIRPIRGAISVQQDITTPKCRSTIKKLMAENGCRAFDLVLHDGSPNVGGAWAKEATSQNSLVIDSVKLATELLAPKGTFITKIFRSQDYNAVLYCLRQLFEKVEVDKPLASRSASAEIYIIGFKYKAPSKIDPRLLDVKHLFQGGKEPPKVIDVLGGTKQKRHRDGYEDGATVLRKVCSVADFVWSDNPVQVLGTFSSMSSDDPACLAIRDHTLTTEEVKSLCDDLRVLAKQDFKYLLKWRMQIRKALSPEKIKTPTVVESESKEDEGEDEDERVLNEIEEKTNILEKKQKKEKKLQAKRRAKEKARKALGIQVDATEDGYGDQDLFSLSSIKGKKDLVAVDNSEYDKETTEVSDESDEEAREHSSSDLDSEDERRRHDDNIEALFDEAYERYLGRVEGKSKQRKRSKQAHLKDDLQDGNDDSTMIDSAQDSESDMEDNEVNPLVVPLEDAPPQEEIVKKWFTQDVFAEAEEQDVLDKYDSEDEMQIDGGAKKIQKSKELTNDKQQGETKDLTRKKTNLQVSASRTDDDFEIVPAPATDSSDSSSDESDDDIDTKAEILATAKMMLKKRPRDEMIDDAYNRYMFHDEGLPKWFIDEEKRNFQPVKPVTKEEIAAMRAQFKAIDARPAKKVAEAKARKKRAAHRKLEKFRKKANTISDQTEISEGSKRKMIEQLYRKASSTKKPEREYVVAKKGVQVKVGKGKVLVDPRMKKDARKHGMKKKKQQDKGKKGNQKGKGSGKASAAGNKGGRGK